jgi:TRAP-type C4-dicarboxylate transport system substrate-binding protein
MDGSRCAAALALAIGAAAPLPAAAEDPAQAVVTLKLATLAPSGSAWHDLLRELGRQWEADSGGRVKLRIYAGGAQGSEGEVIRKLGIGQLQAAALTNVGLHDVFPEPQAVTVPLLFKDEAEMGCAFARVRPRLDALLLEHGLVVVQWRPSARWPSTATRRTARRRRWPGPASSPPRGTRGWPRPGATPACARWCWPPWTSCRRSRPG